MLLAALTTQSIRIYSGHFFETGKERGINIADNALSYPQTIKITTPIEDLNNKKPTLEIPTSPGKSIATNRSSRSDSSDDTNSINSTSSDPKSPEARSKQALFYESPKPLSKLPTTVVIKKSALVPNAISLKDSHSDLEIIISNKGQINSINGNKASAQNIVYSLEKCIKITLSNNETINLSKAFESKSTLNINSALAAIAQNHGKNISEADIFNAIKNANNLPLTTSMSNAAKLQLAKFLTTQPIEKKSPSQMDSPITISESTLKQAAINEKKSIIEENLLEIIKPLNSYTQEFSLYYEAELALRHETPERNKLLFQNIFKKTSKPDLIKQSKALAQAISSIRTSDLEIDYTSPEIKLINDVLKNISYNMEISPANHTSSSKTLGLLENLNKSIYQYMLENRYID